MGKTKKKGSKKGGMGSVVALLVALFVLPVSASAGEVKLTFSEPYEPMNFYASLNLGGGNLDERGGGLNAVFGPLAVLKTDAQRVMSLAFSVGVAAIANEGATEQQVFGGSFGFGPCWMNDMICTHPGYKVDMKTGKRHPQGMVMTRVFKF